MSRVWRLAPLPRPRASGNVPLSESPPQADCGSPALGQQSVGEMIQLHVNTRAQVSDVRCLNSGTGQIADPCSEHVRFCCQLLNKMLCAKLHVRHIFDGG